MALPILSLAVPARVKCAPSDMSRPVAYPWCQSGSILTPAHPFNETVIRPRTIPRWPLIRTGLAGAPSFVPSGCPAGAVEAADRPDRARRAPSRPLVSIRNRSVGMTLVRRQGHLCSATSCSGIAAVGLELDGAGTGAAEPLDDDLVAIRLAHPIADRRGAALELAGQLPGRATRANQLHRLAPARRRGRRWLLRQRNTSSAQSSGVHQTGAAPTVKARPSRTLSRVGQGFGLPVTRDRQRNLPAIFR